MGKPPHSRVWWPLKLDWLRQEIAHDEAARVRVVERAPAVLGVLAGGRRRAHVGEQAARLLPEAAAALLLPGGRGIEPGGDGVFLGEG